MEYLFALKAATIKPPKDAMDNRRFAGAICEGILARDIGKDIDKDTLVNSLQNRDQWVNCCFAACHKFL